MNVALISLGCPKNLVDSEIILGILKKHGFSLTSEWYEADAVIINTCAFIKGAVREANQWIKELISYKRSGTIKKLIVTGCLVERAASKLKTKFPEIDGILSINQLTKIPEALRKKERTFFITSPPSYLYTSKTPRVLTSSSYAYLKIADGCDNFCSYCLIPYLRGSFRSRKIEDILQEARDFINLNIKELILIAQDTTLYGKDIYKKLRLPLLLSKLSKLKGAQWVRLMYTHPAHWTPELIHEFHNNPKLCRYIDLPIQHISDRILKLMNRPYSRLYLEKLLDRLAQIDDLAIRTTIIVGFPTETEKEFNELLTFIKHRRFAHLGCFIYSREEKTPASKLSSSIPFQEKKARYDAIMKTQQDISKERMKNFVGRILQVIVDEKLSEEEYNYLGRTEFDAPEIDGVVYIKTPKKTLKIGEIIKVKITESRIYDLVGELYS
jgi:ribosomal protein S12 methylthiotransferase